MEFIYSSLTSLFGMDTIFVLLHIPVPDAVQLIGYDGLRILNVGDYPVSSIAQPVEQMALTCVDTLIKLINNEPAGR